MRDGQRSVTQGMVGKKIPACVTCHGAELGGREPGIPGLLGLRADYVSAQLGAWRFCVRTAMTPDCMQFIASSLNEPEVAAVPVGLLAAAAWVPRRARSNAPKQGQPPSSTHNSCATSSQATARAS
jgi:cytochrome c553